ncbi:helix-turn-helix domain-containing protein [Vibrio marisflavi]|uniref:HTH cro/C1-type domain-containing protein n=1 Tax=Vibrio marisflavi CECT 7928 TaxID=634439 RepID=A0ABM9A1M7_9VIBR|nr:helix-turn-helix transcriptional regulator [Vibrio marisflavi]CAH0537766.1 hypothetical protein VMF7928_01319 [Vibrio marisflavi CECT 7928]
MVRSECKSMAERFLWALEQKGISQRELARRLDTNPVFLSKLGTGKSKKTRMVVDIALELDVTPEWLEYGIENNRTHIELSCEEMRSANQTFLSKVAEKLNTSSLSINEIHEKTQIPIETVYHIKSGQHNLSLVEALLLCDLFNSPIYEMIKAEPQANRIPLIGGRDIIDNVVAAKRMMEVEFDSDSQHLIGICNDGSFTGHYLNQGNVVIIDPEIKSFNIKNGDSCLFLSDDKIDIGLKNAGEVRSLNYFTHVYDLSKVQIIGKVAFLELNPISSDTSSLLKEERDRLIKTIQKIIPDGTLIPQLS